MAAVLKTFSQQQDAVVQASFLQRWAVVRVQELDQAWRFLSRAVKHRSFPSDDQLSYSAVWTAFCTLILGQATIVLLTGVGRRHLVLGVQTIVALLLLLALMGVVLGLPVGMSLFTPGKFCTIWSSGALHCSWASCFFIKLPVSGPAHSLCCADPAYTTWLAQTAELKLDKVQPA